MALGEREAVDLLRAVAHARMYVTSGRGVESIVHQIATGDLGPVSRMLTPLVGRMEIGVEAEIAVKELMDTLEDPYMRAFLAAIVTSGAQAVQRLDEISEALHAERGAQAEIQASKLSGLVNMTATLFVFSFAPTILKVVELIPENPVVPTIKLPWWLDDIFYGFMAVVLTVLLGFSARSR